MLLGGSNSNRFVRDRTLHGLVLSFELEVLLPRTAARPLAMLSDGQGRPICRAHGAGQSQILSRKREQLKTFLNHSYLLHNK